MCTPHLQVLYHMVIDLPKTYEKSYRLHKTILFVTLIYTFLQYFYKHSNEFHLYQLLPLCLGSLLNLLCSITLLQDNNTDLRFVHFLRDPTTLLQLQNINLSHTTDLHCRVCYELSFNLQEVNKS